VTHGLHAVADGLRLPLECAPSSRTPVLPPGDGGDAAPEVEEVFDEIRAFSAMDRPPAVFRHMARDPGFLRGYWGATREAFGDRRLDRFTKEVLALAASLTARSDCGVDVHPREARRLGLAGQGLIETVEVVQLFSTVTKIAGALPLQPDFDPRPGGSGRTSAWGPLRSPGSPGERACRDGRRPDTGRRSECWRAAGESPTMTPAMAETLLDKVWRAHTVRTLASGQTQLLIGLHLVHEVTSPQAFQMLRDAGLRVRMPERTFATLDHIIPTTEQRRPFGDPLAEEMTVHLLRNVRDFRVPLFDLDSGRQGIVHVIGPELGLTQPGMTIACGDSHTSTHGAVGAIAFGIGTSQVRDVLATQCLAMAKPRLRQVRVEGTLGPGVHAKDVILAIIRRLGVNGGVGYAYEYAGAVIERMSMEERLTVCNMSIEGGARCGYVNPDAVTFDYLRGRPYAPEGPAFDRAVAWWRSLATDPGARFDDVVTLDGGAIAPVVTWGINPGQSVGVDERIPDPRELPEAERSAGHEALQFMDFRPGQPIADTRIDVAFVGSCTNGRLSDLRAAAAVARGRRVAPGVRALIVPGSQAVARAAEAEGLDAIFRAAGFEWRKAGCSMCLGMNEDRLQGREVCASSSNRNFKGRQGSPTGRTLLMSPAMVAAAAVTGTVTDVRAMLR
jgi:3-isopropylmalate/(R)-2-methylmalate dehydratase large subunit